MRLPASAMRCRRSLDFKRQLMASSIRAALPTGTTKPSTSILDEFPTHPGVRHNQGLAFAQAST